jgi:hypothetical protein
VQRLARERVQLAAEHPRHQHVREDESRSGTGDRYECRLDQLSGNDAPARGAKRQPYRRLMAPGNAAGQLFMYDPPHSC